MISLDSKKAIIKENLISKGLSDKTPVYPKQVIEKAMKNGVRSAGLLFPWNRAYAGDGFRLFKNLDEVLDYVLTP